MGCGGGDREQRLWADRALCRGGRAPVPWVGRRRRSSLDTATPVGPRQAVVCVGLGWRSRPDSSVNRWEWIRPKQESGARSRIGDNPRVPRLHPALQQVPLPLSEGSLLGEDLCGH